MAVGSTHALDLDRYLVSFDPRRNPVYRFDVVVVGAGIAGISAASEAARRGANVALLAKTQLEESNTRYAQGGLAAVLAREDSFEAHRADTLQVGCGLCEAGVVDDVVRSAPEAVASLERCGVRFDRDDAGERSLSREGGHAHRRILHAGGDSTGVEIQRAMVQSASAVPNLTLFPETPVADLLTDASGRAAGVIALPARGPVVGFVGREVILATGGAGQIYRETTNPAIATGDGVALAFRAGAVARDLEFVQFHPTCLYIAGAARVLISEVVRGAGGVLRDRHGVRFMPEFHPDAELAPRDVVSRAAFDRMVATDDTSVYLDLSRLDVDPHRAFPGISAICRLFGIDIARDPIPVRPGAHYAVGGLKVDARGRTSVSGLWAAGECASSGMHGANRMGSNSLLEGVVLGTRAGRLAAESALAGGDVPFPPSVTGRRVREDAAVRVSLQDVTYSLKSLMWRQMGIRRNASSMEDALAKIRLWTRAVQELAPADAAAVELLNMLTVARLATIGALARTESRGVHYRTDHPDLDAAWCAHTELCPVLERGRIARAELRRAPVEAPGDAPGPAVRPVHEAGATR